MRCASTTTEAAGSQVRRRLTAALLVAALMGAGGTTYAVWWALDLRDQGVAPSVSQLGAALDEGNEILLVVAVVDFLVMVAALAVALHWARASRSHATRAPPREERVGPAAVPHYVSADTAPAKFAVARRVIVAPAFLLVYAVLCAALVPLLPTLMSSYGRLLSILTGVPAWQVLGKGGSLSFRPFLLALVVLLSLFAVGSLTQRLRLLAAAVALYSAAVLLVDVVLTWAQGPLVPPFSQVGGIATGLVGLLAIVVTIFLRYQLPPGIKVVSRRPTSRRVVGVLAVCCAVAIVLIGAFSLGRARYFDDFHIRFVGGLDSELVLFLLGMVVLLSVVSIMDRASKPAEGPWLSVAFIIPAFNEAHEIGATIAAIDVATGRYGLPCKLYVVDNGSSDGTVDSARCALRECAHLRGRVLSCPIPGKSHALNHGLKHITEDIVVRIDADTLVEPSVLENLVPWFWDPSIGGVGGMPLPKRSAPRWLYPLRIIEVYYGVLFLRVAQGAADAVLVMPGLIAAYRRELLLELGGFGEGFNGEDADVTVRIGRLGYRIVTDPAVRVHTEVPETIRQLREQRQRWSRGLFHMAGRNMSSIWMRQGPRALWNLPWSIFNASRRSMMIPVLVCALTVEVLAPTVFALREVSVVAGFLVGLQLIVISLLLIAHRKLTVIPFVPAYLVFRMFRAYIAFETVLTLRLRDGAADDRRAVEGNGHPPRTPIASRAGLSANQLAPMRASLAAFVEDVLASIPERDLRRWGELYVRGLILEGTPKSIAGVAGRLAHGDERGLAWLLHRGTWPSEPVRARLAARITEALHPVAWIVDEIGIPTVEAGVVGAARQYSRDLGGIAHCQIAVTVSLAGEAASCPVDWRLLLPAADGGEPAPGRRWRLALDMLDELRRWGYAGPLVCAGPGYGDTPQFREGLERRGLRYLVEVKPAMKARYAPGAPRLPLRELALSTGSRGARLVAWRVGLSEEPSRFLVVRVDGSRVVEAARPGAARPPLLALCQWPEDAREPVRYWLSNLPVETGIERLVRIAGLRGRVEQHGREMHDGLGLADARPTSVDGWHRHVTLLSVAWAFLLIERARAEGARRRRLMVGTRTREATLGTERRQESDEVVWTLRKDGVA
jgi:cellulose synthase/poly-beta-1,6-N-acetylglucosamine synthase-like glycosyltransferase/SRSO17 transposase